MGDAPHRHLPKGVLGITGDGGPPKLWCLQCKAELRYIPAFERPHGLNRLGLITEIRRRTGCEFQYAAAGAGEYPDDICEAIRVACNLSNDAYRAAHPGVSFYGGAPPDAYDGLPQQYELA